MRALAGNRRASQNKIEIDWETYEDNNLPEEVADDAVAGAAARMVVVAVTSRRQFTNSEVLKNYWSETRKMICSESMRAQRG